MTPSAANGTAPLFIVGMPRSGTKLLRAVLNQHSQIAIPDIETEFFPYWARQWTQFGDLSDRARFDRLYADFSAYPFATYLRESGTVVDADRWYADCDRFSPAGVFAALIQQVVDFDATQQRYWGDKSPSYLTHIALLHEHFPDARILHIVRDVRDYCLSINHAWGKSMTRAAQRWSDDVLAAHAQGTALGSQYRLVRYEDVLADPEAEAKAICEFLDLAFEPQITTLNQETENLGDAAGHRRIVKSNTRKYESGMSDRNQTRIESISVRALKAFGYDCPDDVRERRVSGWKMQLLKIRDGLSLVAAGIRERGLIGSLKFVTRYHRISGNRKENRQWLL